MGVRSRPTDEGSGIDRSNERTYRGCGRPASRPRCPCPCRAAARPRRRPRHRVYLPGGPCGAPAARLPKQTAGRGRASYRWVARRWCLLIGWGVVCACSEGFETLRDESTSGHHAAPKIVPPDCVRTKICPIRAARASRKQADQRRPDGGRVRSSQFLSPGARGPPAPRVLSRSSAAGRDPPIPSSFANDPDEQGPSWFYWLSFSGLWLPGSAPISIEPSVESIDWEGRLQGRPIRPRLLRTLAQRNYSNNVQPRSATHSRDAHVHAHATPPPTPTERIASSPRRAQP